MNNAKQIIEAMIRKRGINKQDAFRIMKITRPTFIKYMQLPMMMNGHRKQRLADALGVSVEVINRIIHSRQPLTFPEMEEVLEQVKENRDGIQAG